MPIAPGAVLKLMRNLRLAKGRWAGQPMPVQPFQEELTRDVFALREDEPDRRQYQEAVIYMPRKQGKTTLVAAWVLALLMEEPGGEVLGVAAKREQAGLMMSAAKEFVRKSSIGGVPLTEHFQVRRHSIIYPEMDAIYRTISSDASSEHGANPHAVVADELHAWRDPELLIAMTTATAARENPLVIQISTPGERPEGIWWEQWNRVLDLQSGRLEDPQLYGRIWTAPEGCDIDDEEAWETANPGIDTIVTREYLRRQSRTVPEYAFRRLHLGQPTTAHERWLPHHLWTACSKAPDIPDGADVHLGIDAALSRDTFALAIAHVDDDGVAHTITRDFRPPLGADYIDPQEVETFILGLAQRYRIVRAVYDPAYMGLLASSLEDRGVNVEPLAQTAMNMVRATETLQRLVMDERLRHGGDPELDTQMAAVHARETDRGVRISKGRSGGPVDRIVALAMALDSALNGERPEGHFAFAVDVTKPREERPERERAPSPGRPRRPRGPMGDAKARTFGRRRGRPADGEPRERPLKDGWKDSDTEILLVVGPPGAGKSTFVAEEREEADLVIDYDLIAQALGAEAHGDDTLHTEVMAARNALLKRVQRGEVTAPRVWLISANPKAESMFPHHEVITIDPGEDEVLKRADKAGRPEKWRQLIRDWYLARSPSDAV